MRTTNFLFMLFQSFIFSSSLCKKIFYWNHIWEKNHRECFIIIKLWDACTLEYFTISFIFLYLGHSCPVVWDGEDDHNVGGHVGQEVDHHHGLPWGSDHVGVHPQCARQNVDAVEEVAHTVTVLSFSDGVNLCYLRANTDDAIHALEIRIRFV